MRGKHIAILAQFFLPNATQRTEHMAPKRKQLELPELVKNADAEKAKLALQDASEQKRLRSSMRYALDQQGLTSKFDSLSKAFRDEWLLKYTANRLAEKGGKNVTRNVVETINKRSTEGEWMGKETLLKEKGAKRGQALLDSGKLDHQPCSITGLDTEWTREYWVPTEKTVQSEGTNNQVGITTEESLNESNAKDALATLQDASACVLGKIPSSATVPIADVQPQAKAATEEDLPSKASAGKISSDIRKVMRNVSETISALKMTSTVAPNKYNQAILDDVNNMLKQFAKLYTKLENSWLQKVNDEAVIYSLAVDLDAVYAAYKEKTPWFAMLQPAPGKTKIKKEPI